MRTYAGFALLDKPAVAPERDVAVRGWLHSVSSSCLAATFLAGPTGRIVRCPPASRPTSTVLYRRNCAGCHGADGKLGPAPPLNDPIFLAIVADDELLQVITDGRHWHADAAL